MYFEQIPKYRDTIMESICKCDAIVDLVRPEDNPKMGAMDLAYKRIFPYDFMVGKTTDVGTYICFDIVAPRIINRSFSDFNIYIWIIAHERTMRTPKGLVTDLLTTEIDKLINGSNCFGLGRVELKSWDKFTPAEDFHGTTLVYRTVDFNRE